MFLCVDNRLLGFKSSIGVFSGLFDVCDTKQCFDVPFCDKIVEFFILGDILYI